MRNTALPLLAAAAAALPMSGCLMEQNARITVGQKVRLEAFEPSPIVVDPDLVNPAVAALPADAPPPPPTADPAAAPPRGVVMLAPVPEPSLLSLDRSDWGRRAVLVPVDRTYHPPTYACRLDYLPRSENTPYAYPAPLEAVAVPVGGIGGQVVETVAAPVLAVGNAAIIVPWMFVQPPWAVRTSPQIAYERYWHDPLDIPFELAPLADPSSPPAVAEPVIEPVPEAPPAPAPAPDEDDLP